MSARRSGLQNDVIALYRKALRMVRTKPEETRPNFLLNVRYQFRTKGAGYTRRDGTAIEYLIRAGHRQVDMLNLPSIRNCGITKEMTEWAGQERQRARGVRKDL